MKISLVSVEVRNGDVNKALKVFKSKVAASNHINELKDRKEFLKPSVRKRLKMEEARRKNSIRVQIQKYYDSL